MLGSDRYGERFWSIMRGQIVPGEMVLDAPVPAPAPAQVTTSRVRVRVRPRQRVRSSIMD